MPMRIELNPFDRAGSTTWPGRRFRGGYSMLRVNCFTSEPPSRRTTKWSGTTDTRIGDFVILVRFLRGLRLERPALTAVHDDGRAADPAGAGRGEEGDHLADLLRP